MSFLQLGVVALLADLALGFELLADFSFSFPQSLFCLGLQVSKLLLELLLELPLTSHVVLFLLLHLLQFLVVVSHELFSFLNFCLELFSQLGNLLRLGLLLVLKGVGFFLQLRLLSLLHLFRSFRFVNHLLSVLHLFMSHFKLLSELLKISWKLDVSIINFRSFL